MRRPGHPFIDDHCAEIRRLMPNQAIRLVFDVGANVGSTVANYLRNFETARIIAFEPIGPTYARLVSRVGTSPRVCCMNFALGSRTGTCVVHHQRHAGLNSLHEPINIPDPACQTSETVTVMTLDQIVSLNQTEHIDVLKLDTEHFDLEVLHGAARTLAEDRITFVYSEVTFNHSDQRHTYFTALADFLERYRFTALGFSEHIYQSPPDTLDHCNALFAHRSLLAP